MQTVNDLIAILSQINISIDLNVIVAMLSIGYIIKHAPSCKSVSNNLIPWISVIGCLFIEFMKIDHLTRQTFVDTIVTSIVSAAITVGIHQYGKNFFISVRKALDFLNEKNDKSK